MHILTDEIKFPPVSSASPDGILAIGGDLLPDRLLFAYRNGIFPWFEDDDPIIWWSPDPRMVLFLDDLYVSKSMRKILDSGLYKVTFNQNFIDVIHNCKTVSRINQKGTWITSEMIKAYTELNNLGFAKSC